MKNGGFTLLETMVAMVVAATAAAVILAAIRGLMDRVERERIHDRAVTGVLNDSARLSLKTWPVAQTLVEREAIRLLPVQADLPELTVRNFSLAPETVLPPPQVAYTPYQTYSLAHGEHRITFIARSLVPPDGFPAFEEPKGKAVQSGRQP